MKLIIFMRHKKVLIHYPGVVRSLVIEVDMEHDHIARDSRRTQMAESPIKRVWS